MERSYRDPPSSHRPPEHPPAHPPPHHHSLLLAVLNWLMTITTWNRVFITLVLGGSLLVGTLVYRYPQRVFELLSAALQPAPPKELPYMSMQFTDNQREINRLLGTFGPDMIVVSAWKVDLVNNELKLVNYASAPEYEETIKQLVKVRWQWPVALFGDDPEVNHALGRLYIGRFVCTTPPKGWKTLSRFPIAEVCMIGVPPNGPG